MDSIGNLLYSFEADLTNALNLAGLKAAKEIGKHPVIVSAYGTSQQMNQYRLKAIIREELNVYLTGHYLYNMFTDGHYAINIILQNDTAIPSTENISLLPCTMKLERYSIPMIGPDGTKNYSTYLVVSLPLYIEIRQLKEDQWVLLTTRTVLISSILTSRYPLLENLMNEYDQSINGTFSSLWSYTTVLSNLYTLIRGFKHYRMGRPLNVVDNRHLSVVLNSGLLLEQCLVFGSVDPLGLVDLAREILKTLKKTPSDALTTFNNEMEGDGYSVETENLSKGSANADAESPINETIDIAPSFNLTDLAERILYTIESATFYFKNDLGDHYEETVVFDDDVQTRINDLIQHQANQSYYLTSVTKHLRINTTTLQHLGTIIDEIYHDSFSMIVVERSVAAQMLGDPGENWTDGGYLPWNVSVIVPVLKKEIKPPKGQITPGCAVYEEQYNVSYERTHIWWQSQESIINGTIVQSILWNNQTDFLFETVVLQSILHHWATYQTAQDDIVDVLYFNETLNDQNLEDTVVTYLALYNDTNPEKQALISAWNNTSTVGLEAIIPGFYEEWVCEEAWNALETIFESIRHITLDSSITAKKYPNPVLLVEAAKNDLLSKYNQNLSGYLDFSSYHPGSLFCSVGKKVVYSIREWFVYLMQNTTEAYFSSISQQLSNAIEKAIPLSAGFTAKNLTETLDDASDALQNQFMIPFGYDMNLSRYNQQGVLLWNETIRLAVDHYPNYLNPFERTPWENEEIWTLKIRNRCVFGPTGLPLLPPSPLTVWMMTLNLWVIDIEGEYPVFKVIDTSDETIFNPLLGHEPQSYVRELKVISAGNVTLGQNTRLSFNFTTVAFGLVPPWGMMLGDIQDNWYDEHTSGFDEG